MRETGSSNAGCVLYPAVLTADLKHPAFFCGYALKKIGFLLTLLLYRHPRNAHTWNASMPTWMNGQMNKGKKG